MWNAAAGVDGMKRGIPSDSRPAFVGCSASTSLSTGSALNTRDSGRCGGSGRSTRIPLISGSASSSAIFPMTWPSVASAGMFSTRETMPISFAPRSILRW